MLIKSQCQKPPSLPLCQEVVVAFATLFGMSFEMGVPLDRRRGDREEPVPPLSTEFPSLLNEPMLMAAEKKYERQYK